MGLEGKVAVVYSGARGIGRAYCEALLQKGCKVFFGDILEQEGANTQKKLQERYKDSKIVFKKCDVLDKAQVKEMMSVATVTLGSVDIVIANTGILEERDWERCLELNLGSILRIFYVIMEFLSKTQGGQGGHFVATSSLGGLRPLIALPVYTATKHGIVGFIRTWGCAENYAVTGIRCNTICPACVDTKLIQDVKADQFILHEQSEHLCKSIGEFKEQGLLLSPSEVGKSLIKLLENDGANGQCLQVTTQESVYAAFTEEPI